MSSLFRALADGREFVAVEIADIGGIEMGMVGAQTRPAFIGGACRDCRRMEGIDGCPRFGGECDHGAVARSCPVAIEGRHHPEAAARIAWRGIADLLLRKMLATIAEHGQNGIVKMPCAVEVVGSERDVKKHGIIIGRDRPEIKLALRQLPPCGL